MRLAILAAVGVMSLAPIAEAFAAEEWIARVKRVAGDAVVEVDGRTAPIAVGDRLPADAVIRTGARSGVGLTFKDNTRASVGANAELALARYAFTPGDSRAEPELEARLDKGVAAFVSGRVTKRKPGAMQVRTPAALLGVRGTTFVAVTGTPLDQ